MATKKVQWSNITMNKSKLINWIKLLSVTLAVTTLPTTAATKKQAEKQPNIIIIFADDMGYGDMSNNGHPTLRTPNLDNMAAEGQKWTNFYVVAPVCSPSRAGLMTGRYPVRSGLASSTRYRNVFRGDSLGGMPKEELTIAEALKSKGYKTGMVGKWHIGHLPEFLPTQHGFDSWFGIPYSNDMNQDFELIKKVNKGNWDISAWNKGVHWEQPKSEYFQVPLMSGETVLERGPDQHQLTKRYTQKAQAFIRQNKEQPFFLYLAHAMPHVPLFASKEFEGRSTQGLYGDVIEELDWSVGQVLQTLKDEGIDDNTLVIFSSDNGPWLMFETMGGSAGSLRGGKGETFEGGVRVPTIFWWPEHIKPALNHNIGTTIDILPTVMDLVGGNIPSNLDGISLSASLLEGKASEREAFYYYRGADVYAVRKGRYKAHFLFKEFYANPKVVSLEKPLLYDLNADPGEKYNIAAKHPEIIAELRQLRQQHIESLVPIENQLDKCVKNSPMCL